MSEEEKNETIVSEESEADSSEPKLPTGDVGQEVNAAGVTNPDAAKEVELDNPLKQWFVEYVGEKYKPEGGVVTVELAIRAFAEEFPEFLMVLAEENWIRGYQQGVADSEEGVKQALQQAGVQPPENLIAPENESSDSSEGQLDSEDE